MYRLSYGFVLGYHGCDIDVGESLLSGTPFRASDNDYDWLGPGIYFWEANPVRGLEFAAEALQRRGSRLKTPFVVGAVIDLGACLDLTSSLGLSLAERGYRSLLRLHEESRTPLPVNSRDRLRRNLDCAVVRRVHAISDESGRPFDTVRGVFTEGGPAYPGAGFEAKTHIQIALRNPECIKGVFRVPSQHLALPTT